MTGLTSALAGIAAQAGRTHQFAGRRRPGDRLRLVTEPSVVAASVLCMALATAAPVIAATVSVKYAYDGLGRVATALYDNGVCVAYTYDASGNRTSQSNTAASAPESPVWGSGISGSFAWTAAHALLERRATVRAPGIAPEKTRP